MLSLDRQPSHPSRIVLIGGGGFIGQAIARALARRGHGVRVLARAEVDLLSERAESHLRQIVLPGDRVVMIAAKSPAKTPALLEANITMAASIARALSAAKLDHFLYVSSDAVYADEARPVREGSARAPSTLHGIMHLAREAIFAEAIAAPQAVLRPTLVYGPADPHNGYGPNRFAREAKAGGPVRYFGAGEEQRDHVFIDDVGDLAAQMICRRAVGALNAATGQVARFGDIAREIAARMGVAAQSIPRPGPRPHVLHRHFDIATCRAAFPDFRFTPLKDGLTRLLA